MDRLPRWVVGSTPHHTRAQVFNSSEKIKINILYAKTKIASLKPKRSFDLNWLEQFYLLSYLHGAIQKLHSPELPKIR